MGYDTTGTNDKAIIGVAVASALTLAGLIPLFHNQWRKPGRRNQEKEQNQNEQQRKRPKHGA